MTVKLICFEDNPTHQEMLRKSFEHHNATIRFFGVADWHILPERAQLIAEFDPDIIIVDLMNDLTHDTNDGYRVIRDLKDRPETKQFPVIAWSVLFKNTLEGNKFIRRAEGFGAIPLQKSLEMPTPAESFLQAAHLI